MNSIHFKRKNYRELFEIYAMIEIRCSYLKGKARSQYDLSGRSVGKQLMKKALKVLANVLEYEDRK